MSSSRYEKQRKGASFRDESGELAERLVLERGHLVVGKRLVPDRATLIRSAIRQALASGRVDVVVTTGGTGISPTDVTVETVRPLLEKELPGVGELLRSVSYAKVGASAMLSRATGGVIRGKLVLCLPGSPQAVETALGVMMEEIPHAVFIARGGKSHRAERKTG